MLTNLNTACESLCLIGGSAVFGAVNIVLKSDAGPSGRDMVRGIFFNPVIISIKVWRDAGLSA
jgi:hypothetical protein